MAFVPHCLNALTLRGDQIEEIGAFLTTDVFEAFGLPAAVAA